MSANLAEILNQLKTRTASDCRKVKHGTVVKIVGRASMEAALTSPLHAVPCVYYKAEVFTKSTQNVSPAKAGLGCLCCGLPGVCCAVAVHELSKTKDSALTDVARKTISIDDDNDSIIIKETTVLQVYTETIQQGKLQSATQVKGAERLLELHNISTRDAYGKEVAVTSAEAVVRLGETVVAIGQLIKDDDGTMYLDALPKPEQARDWYNGDRFDDAFRRAYSSLLGAGNKAALTNLPALVPAGVVRSKPVAAAAVAVEASS